MTRFVPSSISISWRMAKVPRRGPPELSQSRSPPPSAESAFLISWSFEADSGPGLAHRLVWQRHGLGPRTYTSSLIQTDKGRDRLHVKTYRCFWTATHARSAASPECARWVSRKQALERPSPFCSQQSCISMPGAEC